MPTDPVFLTAVAAALVALAFLLGAVIGRYAWPATRGVDAAALSAAQIENGRLSARAIELQHELDEQKRLFQAAEIDRRAVEAAKAAAEARLADRERLEDQFKTEFENIANRILKARSAELSEGSQKELGALLEPLRQRIHDFQNKVETTYQSETREVLSLKEQIRLLVETSNAVGSQADGLAKALRGDSQLLGRWGEIALERILEAAGLCEGREYIAQGRGLGLRSDTGGLQRPDIVVLLPEQRTLIIDSKVSLAGYERLIACGDPAEAGGLRSQFVRDVKLHIDGLSGKRYQENEKLLAHDCVLMFVPIEGALSEVLRSDPSLFFYAWERRVVLVGPSNLLVTMQTVASMWRYELQGRNAQEIARLAGDLIDKVSTSLEDLNTVAVKLADAEAAHNQAVKRLSTGRGNALSIGERIRKLGVKSRHPMPAMVVDGATVAAIDQDDDDIPVLASSTGYGSQPREAAE